MEPSTGFNAVLVARVPLEFHSYPSGPKLPARGTWLALVVAAGAALCGCQPLFGIERVSLSTEDPPEESCDAPGVADTGVRIGNLMAGPEAIDLCVRGEGERDYRSRTLIERVGTGCPNVAYKQITVPLALDPGDYDVKVVAAEDDCRDAGIATASLTIEDGEVYSILLIGGGATAAELEVLVDVQPAFRVSQLRFLHAAPGFGRLEIGVVDASGYADLFTPTKFGDLGASALPGTFPIARGYMQHASDIALDMVALEEGTDNELLSLPVNFPRDQVHTLYAIGVDGDETFPPELWTCRDAPIDANPVLPLFSSCGDPRDLQVEVFDTGLSDRFSSYVTERRPVAIAAIAEMDADIACLTGLYYPDDVAAIVDAVGDRRHVLTSLELRDRGEIDRDHLQDQSGEWPSYGVPECVGAEDLLQAMLTCLVEGVDGGDTCTETVDGEQVMRDAGDELGNCWSHNCWRSVGALVDEAPTCYACVVAAFGSDASVKEARTRCLEGTTLEDRLAFGGTLGLMVLSDAPIVEGEARALPSSTWAHGMVRARVEIENGEQIDFYCGSTGVADHDTGLPYFGRYGDGETGHLGELAEQRLVIKRMLEFVNEKSDAPGARAIVAGSIYAGPRVVDPRGNVLVDGWLPELYDILASELPPLVATDYEPRCNACVDNPAGESFTNRDVTVGSWVTHLFGRGFRPSDVHRTSLTFEDPVVTTQDGYIVPLSPQYGLRSRVRVEQ